MVCTCLLLLIFCILESAATQSRPCPLSFPSDLISHEEHVLRESVSFQSRQHHRLDNGCIIPFADAIMSVCRAKVGWVRSASSHIQKPGCHAAGFRSHEPGNTIARAL